MAPALLGHPRPSFSRSIVLSLAGFFIFALSVVLSILALDTFFFDVSYAAEGPLFAIPTFLIWHVSFLLLLKNCLLVESQPVSWSYATYSTLACAPVTAVLIFLMTLAILAGGQAFA